MTPQQLKNSILQMAMQGKLVEQRPEEGTGEELYNQIQKEKQKLIKEGKIKKEKPLPEITEEEVPFEIPESWKWVRIGKTFDLQAGKNKTSSQINDEQTYNTPYACYGGNGIRGYVKDYNREGSFALIGRQGALCGNINFARGKFYATEHAVVVECFGGTDVKWSGYFLKALNLNQFATATAQPGLAVSNINNVLIPLPPLAEQKRIVAKIEEIMPYIDRYAVAYDHLQSYNTHFPDDLKKSILQMAIQGKLVPQDPNDEPASVLLEKIAKEKQKLIKEGKIKKQKPLPEITEDEIPFDIPENWEWVRLGSVIDLLSGTDFKPSEYSDFTGKTPYITGASCLSETGVIVKRWTNTPKNIAFKGDLLLVCKGSGYGKSVISDIDEAHIARQIMSIRGTFSLNLKYVRYFIMSEETYIKCKGQGVIPGIDRNTILNMPFPLPPLAEQKRIVARLDELLPQIDELK